MIAEPPPIAGRVVSDYETITGTPLSANRGPTCATCLNLHKHCTCAPAKPGSPLGPGRMEPDSRRSADALELIAYQLKRIADYLTVPAVVAITPSEQPIEEIPMTVIKAEGSVEPVPPPALADPAKLKANQARKDALLGGLGAK